MTYEDVILADNPLAFYMLDELAGTNAADSSGNGYDGTYVNTPTLGAASLLVGGPTAASFVKASTQYVDLTGLFGTAFLDTVPGFSIEGWVKPTDVADFDQGFFGTWTGTNGGPMFWTHFSNGRLYVTAGVGEANYLDTGLTPVNGTTYHLVATYDIVTTDLIAYVNGVNIAQRTWPFFGSMLDSWEISGYNSFTFCFTGTEQAIALYEAPLTPTQVTTHYNAGLGVFPASGNPPIPFPPMLRGRHG